MNRPFKDRYDLLRQKIAKFVLDKKTKQNKVFDISKTKSILFLRNDDKIGDMLISTLLFREIKKAYPHIKIFVLCGSCNKEIIKYNPNVDEIIELERNFFKNILKFRELAKRKISLIADFLPLNPKPKYLLMLKLLKPEFLTGYYKEQYNIYDFSFEKRSPLIHITDYYGIFLDFLGIKNPSFKYDLFLNPNSAAAKYSDKDPQRKSIIINPSAASRHRRLSIDKLISLADLIGKSVKCRIFILSYGNVSESLKPLISENVLIFQSKSILDAAEIIKNCDLVISPDTSIVHIADAFNKKLISLYPEMDRPDNIIWTPRYLHAVNLFVDTKGGLVSNDVENISDETIVKEALKLLC
ncbi:MAG: hypothetical protein LBU09_05160 [Endomicrobium sp.]|jgi:ADP-heptose:LPS heptosyltransferase|nr:hypothetical protein [Endomicrobium sp.]